MLRTGRTGFTTRYTSSRILFITSTRKVSVSASHPVRRETTLTVQRYPECKRVYACNSYNYRDMIQLRGEACWAVWIGQCAVGGAAAQTSCDSHKHTHQLDVGIYCRSHLS